MIDSKMFDVAKLVDLFLGRNESWHHGWRAYAEIIPRYMSLYPGPNERPRCVVKLGNEFLRYSKGPLQNHFWDVYGDDYFDPELALLALSQAPPPPRWEYLGLKDARVLDESEGS